MSQVGPKRRAARKARLLQMFITARVVGVTYLDPLTYNRATQEQLRMAKIYYDGALKGVQK